MWSRSRPRGAAMTLSYDKSCDAPGRRGPARRWIAPSDILFVGYAPLGRMIAEAVHPGPGLKRDTAQGMSQENVEFVRRAWEAYEGGDLSAA